MFFLGGSLVGGGGGGGGEVAREKPSCGRIMRGAYMAERLGRTDFI